jgi:3-methyladenine DNA glycosylase Tag
VHQEATAIRMFEAAKAYCEENYADELDWANSISPETFRNLRAKRFLSEYCWVVYASGFKVSTVEAIFPNLRTAFKEFELEDLGKMKSIKPVLAAFNNERKANSFLEGSKLIAKEGFSAFKKRLRKEGLDMLEQLPGIGPITKYHLAKNIGLVDEAKPDIWLVRAADVCSSTVQELVAFLSEKYSMSRHAVDVILWRYGADKGLEL